MGLESYKDTFPYICNSCGEFAHTLTEYCEKCGTKDSLREANNNDYKEKVNEQKISIIPEEEIKKCLIYSIIIIVATFFLGVLGLNYPFPTTTGIYMFLLSLTWMPIGIISLLFYFIDPEISYGMLMSRKKVKKIGTKSVKIGRRILLVILIIGLCITTLVFILIIRILISYL